MRLSGRQLWIACIVVFEVLALSFIMLHAPAIDEAHHQDEVLRRASSQNIRQCLSPRRRDARFVDRHDACVTPRQRHEALRDLVYETKILMEALGVVYWIDSGTLLGQFRMNDVLPWDTNVDFGILHEGFERLRATDVALSDGYELNVLNSSIYAAHDRSAELPARLVETRFGFYVGIFVFFATEDSSQQQQSMLGPLPSTSWSSCVKCASVPDTTVMGENRVTKHLIVPRDWILPTQRCHLATFDVMCVAQATPYLKHLYGDDFLTPSVW